MDKKYYTPKIEEFHVGFEYELKLPELSGYHNETTGEYNWKGCKVIDPAHIPFHNEYWKQTRVKYLDKDDIEDLGFKEVQDLEPTPGMYIKITEGEYFNVNYIYFNSWDNIIIYDWDMEVIFRGFIWNKSELSRLMLQLGIDGK